MPSNQRRKRSHRRQALLVLFIVSAFLAGIAVLHHWVTHREFYVAYFEHPDGSKSSKYLLEVVATEPDRQRGLMFRQPEDFPANRGMLFVFPDSDIRRFWMRNTYISLDMIFMDEDMRVVGIVHEAPILTTDQQSVDRLSMYVLEVLAGQARAQSIDLGSRLHVEGSLPQAR